MKQMTYPEFKHPQSYALDKAMETQCQKKWAAYWDMEKIKYKYLAHQAYLRNHNEPGNKDFEKRAIELSAIFNYVRQQHEWHFQRKDAN